MHYWPTYIWEWRLNIQIYFKFISNYKAPNTSILFIKNTQTISKNISIKISRRNKQLFSYYGKLLEDSFL